MARSNQITTWVLQLCIHLAFALYTSERFLCDPILPGQKAALRIHLEQ